MCFWLNDSFISLQVHVSFFGGFSMFCATIRLYLLPAYRKEGSARKTHVEENIRYINLSLMKNEVIKGNKI